MTQEMVDYNAGRLFRLVGADAHYYQMEVETEEGVLLQYYVHNLRTGALHELITDGGEFFYGSIVCDDFKYGIELGKAYFAARTQTMYDGDPMEISDILDMTAPLDLPSIKKPPGMQCPKSTAEQQRVNDAAFDAKMDARHRHR